MIVATKPTVLREGASDPESRYGRDEMNLAAFPLSLLDDRSIDPSSKEPIKTLEFEDQIIDPARKEPLVRRVTVTGADKWGLPAGEDIAVLMALVKHSWEKNRFSADKVYFARKELLEILGWPVQGRNYQRLETAMKRWSGVKVDYRNWWDNDTGKYSNPTFSILDNVTFFDERRRARKGNEDQLGLFQSWFKWNEVILKSFQASYLRPLDDAAFFKLSSPAAMNAMRFLNVDLPSDGSPRRYALEAFCQEKIGMRRSHSPSRLKRDLERIVIDPLVETEFLQPMNSGKRFDKEGRKFAWVWFARKEKLRQRTLFPDDPDTSHVETNSQSSREDESSAVIGHLRQRRLSGRVAEQFAREYPEDYLLAKIDLLDWMMERHPSQVKTNPGGWLRKAIEDDYAPPPDYVPREERDRARREAEVSRQSAEKKLEDERRNRLAEQAKDRLEALKREHIHARLCQLTPGQKQQLETDVTAQAGSDDQEILAQKDAIGRIKLRILVEQEVLRRHPFPGDETAS